MRKRYSILASATFALTVVAGIALAQPSVTTAYEQAKSAVYFATRDLQRLEQLYAAKLATADQLATARKALEDARKLMNNAEKTPRDQGPPSR